MGSFGFHTKLLKLLIDMRKWLLYSLPLTISYEQMLILVNGIPLQIMKYDFILISAALQ